MPRLATSRILHLLLAAWAMSVFATLAQPRDAPESSVAIDAWLSTAGPYGESWSLLVTGDGRAFFEYVSLRTPTGSVTGRFFVDPAAITKVQEQAKAAEFRSLPKALEPSPVPMHSPDYRLRIRLGDEMRSVRVYAPKEVQDAAALQRFWPVWNSVWSLVPLRPRPP